MEKEDKTKVYHLTLKSSDEQRYFASLGALYSNYEKADIGIAYQSLKNHFFKGNVVYDNALCTIRKGVLERNKKGE